MAVDQEERLLRIGGRDIDRVGELQTRVQHQCWCARQRAGDQRVRVGVAHGNGGEPLQPARPPAVQAVCGIVIAKAGGVGHQPVGLESYAKEGRLVPVPGMLEVPDLVAADNDRVIGARLAGAVEAEAPGQRQRCECRFECAALALVGGQVGPRRPFWQRRLEQAALLCTLDDLAMVVEQFGVVAHAAQPLHQATRLPIGTVIVAAVKGEDANAPFCCHQASALAAAGVASARQ